jgi:multidrug efflux pump subunit AcrA (membrane-fusion protein)
VTGFLVARDEAVVTLDAPGLRVTEVLVGEGDRVTSGQTLVRLVRQAGEGQDASAAARTSIILKAPAAGVVTRSTAVVGATASPMQNEPLFRIAVDNEIELEAEVPSIHAGAISPGQTARIQIEDSRELSGRVRQAPAAVDQRTQLGRARLSLERDPWLRLGMFARATIDADRSCGISVPRSAVHYRTEGPRVQVVRDNVIETRVVQVGFHSDMDIEIREGLREGDLIVANAGSSLREGGKPIMADRSSGAALIARSTSDNCCRATRSIGCVAAIARFSSTYTPYAPTIGFPGCLSKWLQVGLRPLLGRVGAKTLREHPVRSGFAAKLEIAMQTEAPRKTGSVPKPLWPNTFSFVEVIVSCLP